MEFHSYLQAQFINDYFDEIGYEVPIKIVMGLIDHYGLWYYDPEYHYGEWRSYEEVLEDIQEIGKKFNQGGLTSPLTCDIIDLSKGKEMIQ